MNAILPSDFERLHDSEAEAFCLGRLWSLWEIMLNYNLFGLCVCYKELLSLQQDYELRSGTVLAELKSGVSYDEISKSSIPHEVTKEDIDHLDGVLNLTLGEIGAITSQSVTVRIGNFRRHLNLGNPTVHDVSNELRILRETIEHELHNVLLHRYDLVKGSVLRTVEADWGGVFNKFEELRAPVRAVIDCYAIGYNRGAVFYLMNVMESATQQFAKKLKVALIKKVPGRRIRELDWQNILDALNPKLAALPQNNMVQKRKFEKYSAIQAYLYSVKDAWRNPTMHPRDDDYNDSETLNIIHQVRSFMSELADVL